MTTQHVQCVNAVVLIAIAAPIACSSEMPEQSHNPPGSVAQARIKESKQSAVLIGPNDSLCEPPNGPIPNAAALGHWFAEDARSHRKTLGMHPPDSAAVKLVGNSALTRRASDVIDSALFKMSGKKVENAPRDREKVYRAGGLYAVVDLDQKFCGSDRVPLPIIFFVDTAWRFLGTRSN
jgi:hypothetical protein